MFTSFTDLRAILPRTEPGAIATRKNRNGTVKALCRDHVFAAFLQESGL
jgi:hypothetical protein